MIGRHAKPDQQVQILRAFGRADDLFELVERVEREGAYAMLPIGSGNRFLGLYRVHEAERRPGQRAGDQTDLGYRRAVIMGTARLTQHATTAGHRIPVNRSMWLHGDSPHEEERCATRGIAKT